MYELLAGKKNEFATANVTTKIKSGIQDTVTARIGQSDAETVMVTNKLKTMFNSKVDTLAEAMVLLAKTMTTRK